ncbi:hypothetical protein [Hymenobacter sp. CRA2]|uniref:hypothetical protein n=1 Tax=Hymenobacter sp. CRA2 TaxID=1955620 RepID=UPI00098EAC7D|nr:hypothetical protein [Hymenobacter sp. CRA2]OON69773.1 hypothetical protein B0919_07555 [Hymenobacter sp. CRA2]
MKRLILSAGLLSGWLSQPAWACRVCRPRVQAGIHTADYAANLLWLLLPVALLIGGGLAVYFAADVKRRFF